MKETIKEKEIIAEKLTFEETQIIIKDMIGSFIAGIIFGVGLMLLILS